MKRAALYTRVSTCDQSVQPQLLDLYQLAKARGYEIVREYSDVISGTKAKRPGLDALLDGARKHRFDVVVCWAIDRLARSTRHFLEIIDELNHLNVEFVSFRENIDTGGPLGRAIIVIVSAISELERSLIVERVEMGMHRAKLEGKRIGREPMNVDREQILLDRRNGLSLTAVAKRHGISRASVCRVQNAVGASFRSVTPQVASPEYAAGAD